MKRPPIPCRRIHEIYWSFAAERQAAFKRRVADKPFPWTDDPILQEYCREAAPELTSARNRIKARFSVTPKPIELFFPPKWGINDRLPESPVLGEMLCPAVDSAELHEADCRGVLATSQFPEKLSATPMGPSLACDLVMKA